MGGKVKEPKTTRKAGRPSKKDSEKKIQQLVDIIENGHFSSYNKIGMAKHLQVTRKTLDNYMEKVKTLIAIPELDVIKVDLIKTYDRLKRRLFVLSERLEEINDDNYDNDKMFRAETNIIKEIRETIKDYVFLLESFGIKEKVADKVDVTADVTQKSFSIQIIDDRSQIERKVE